MSRIDVYRYESRADLNTSYAAHQPYLKGTPLGQAETTAELRSLLNRAINSFVLLLYQNQQISIGEAFELLK